MGQRSGALIAGKYRLEGPLSSGGMGSVWSARHVDLGAPVAVKFMDGSFASSPSFRARFELEARAAANLQSTHVVAVHDYGIDADVPYLVMELLRGEDLHQRLKRRGRLSTAECATLLSQMGKALRRAHEAGFVHRDLKPRNVFLARIDDDEILKVLDFGIAKQIGGPLSAEATRIGEVVGSPHYMSPEQLRADRDLDARSDLWAVGVILFRCLTGKLPFEGDVLGTVMAKVLVEPIPMPSQIVGDLPPAFDAFFAKALARDRGERFSSIRELVEAFVRLAGGSFRGTFVSGEFSTGFGSSGVSSWPRGSLPGVDATPRGAPWAPSAETLVSAGVTGTPVRGRRMRMAWGVAIGIVVILGIGGAMTAVRLAGSSNQDSIEELRRSAVTPATAQTSAAAPAEAVPAPEPASEATVVAAQQDAPAEPRATASPSASTAAASASATRSAERLLQPAAASGPAGSPRPAASTTGSGAQPDWGF